MTLDRPDFDRSVVPGTFTPGGNGATAVAVTGTAVALRATTPCSVVLIKAHRANGATLYLGTSTVTDDTDPATGGFQIDPGDMVAVSTNDLAAVYVNGTAGDGVSYWWWI